MENEGRQEEGEERQDWERRLERKCVGDSQEEKGMEGQGWKRKKRQGRKLEMSGRESCLSLEINQLTTEV